MSKSAAVCRVHDADDVVPGRICGRPLPCRDHPYAGQPARKRVRRPTNLTLSDEQLEMLDRLAEAIALSRSAVVGSLIEDETWRQSRRSRR